MPLDTWVIYVATVLALMSTPGPSHLLMLSNAGRHGFRRALLTAAGDVSANVLQMLAAGLGLAALVAASGTALSAIKWAGVAYLLWLGIRMIRHAGGGGNGAGASAPVASLRGLWMQGFLTSLANPKAVVFFAALFPQFIDPGAPILPQLLVLGGTYLVVDGGILIIWAALARQTLGRLTWMTGVRINRLSGCLMIAAATLLASRDLVAEGTAK